MHSILLIQFRLNDTARKAERDSMQKVLTAKGIKLECVDAINDGIDWSDPKSILGAHYGVILGGSGDLYFDGNKEIDDPSRATMLTIAESMRPFVRYLIEHHIPTLGVCLGHQLFAYVLGAKVIHCTETGKTGTFPVELTEAARNDPLFKDIPDEFDAHYGHKDVVLELPEGSELLARGERCHMATVRYAPGVYSIQFHPELTLKDVEGRMAAHPEYLPAGFSFETMVRPTPHAEQLLANFGDMVLAREREA